MIGDFLQNIYARFRTNSHLFYISSFLFERTINLNIYHKIFSFETSLTMFMKMLKSILLVMPTDLAISVDLINQYEP